MDELKDKLFITALVVFGFIIGAILGNVAPLNPQPKKQPIIIYKVDNQGAEIKGRVAHKEKIGDLHTITIKNYGIFVVTQTSYESLRIGDEVRL